MVAGNGKGQMELLCLHLAVRTDFYTSGGKTAFLVLMLSDR
jgi:hypothetical protein